MSKMKQMDELFGEWKKKHSVESSDSCIRTFPEIPKSYKNKGIELNVEKFKNNWTDDGYLNDSANCKILFILKEANIEELKEEHFVVQSSKFWIKDNREHYKRAIPRRLKKLTVKLLGIDDSLSWYDNVAVMNLNKRGGFSKCNFNNLLNYAKVYSNFIEREIDILNPEIIVFLGKDFFENSKELFDIINFKEKKMSFYFHPSRKGKNNNFTDEKFLIPIFEDN